MKKYMILMTLAAGFVGLQASKIDYDALWRKEIADAGKKERTSIIDKNIVTRPEFARYVRNFDTLPLNLTPPETLDPSLNPKPGLQDRLYSASLREQLPKTEQKEIQERERSLHLFEKTKLTDQQLRTENEQYEKWIQRNQQIQAQYEKESQKINDEWDIIPEHGE